MQAQCPNPDCGDNTITSLLRMAVDSRKVVPALLSPRAELAVMILISGSLTLFLLSLPVAVIANPFRGLATVAAIGLGSAGVGLWVLDEGYRRYAKRYSYYFYENKCDQCGYIWVYHMSDPDSAQKTMRLLEEVLEGEEVQRDEDGKAGALNSLGALVLNYQGDIPRATRLCEESLTIRRTQATDEDVARSLLNLGAATLYSGDLARAQSLLEESTALFEQAKEWSGLAYALSSRGLLALEQDNLQPAKELLSAGLRLQRRLAVPESIAWSLEVLATVESKQGRAARAVRLLGAAHGIQEDINMPIRPLMRPLVEQTIDNARNQIGEPAFTTAWEEGWYMPAEDAIEYALAEED